jgi:hypothetical protein
MSRILDAIPGEYISKASRRLPDARSPEKDEIREVILGVPHYEKVTFRCGDLPTGAVTSFIPGSRKRRRSWKMGLRVR